MRLSRSGEYALRALLHLAEEPAGAPVPTAGIARALDLPANYLSKLLHQLARAGVLRSARGPQGGFSLAGPAEAITLERALAPIEAGRLARRCLLGRPQCTDARPCAAHDEWKVISRRIEAFLQNTTLAQLRRRPEAAQRARPHRAAATGPSRRKR